MKPTHLLAAAKRAVPLTLVLALPALGQTAEPAPAIVLDTKWTCWYNGSMSVLCRVTDAPAEDVAAPYPGQDSLPPAVRIIRERPTALRGRTVTIPLHSPPETMENAEELACAVMCGARAQCRVDFFRNVESLAFVVEEDPALD